MTVSSLADRRRVGHHGRARDLDAAERAASAFLRALGVEPDDPAHPELARTPRRLAEAFAELLTPEEFDFTTFPNTERYGELVLVRDIPLQSLCAHHLLPFVGRAHVAYLPGERIVGLSKLARLVDHFARRPQTQERLTTQVAAALEERLEPRGVGVVMEAEHQCMTLRGARAPGTTTTTSSLRGHLREDPAARAELMALVNTGRG
ncbi:GTP cyclohydrolase I FolE [Nocardioides agariphilus]|jgi:GTP cyclohydrolase I|uniref:GTP cyclohydrolase 1 n=1 Tax=Nocardioides agariphilus TaxID=433664 RepID=A0A930VIK5_9ACTN|nr:GTP cyclohydrolase I FolE [Nocardioides agariphilus]MBF4767358.1 GTP cyclohydrolase I FolE [Nocardioides agariphilus]